jgi:hypothetical protein
MNEVTKLSTDNFAAAANAASQTMIVGQRLRFSKGLYLIGRGDAAQLSAGTKLQAIDVQAAWVKFADGQVVDQRVGYPMPDRDELDDLDEGDWPIGFDGKPNDPWSNQRYLYLVDPVTGSDYTFVTSSWGGRAAVEQLARQVFIKRSSAPGAIAIVQLNTGHKRSRTYGNVPCPRFDIVGWVGEGEPQRTPARPALTRELDDEIPF